MNEKKTNGLLTQQDKHTEDTLFMSLSIILFVAKSIITRTDISAQMIASLNLFFINGICCSVSRVAVIYIGILHGLFSAIHVR
jgi:hypothetical protein